MCLQKAQYPPFKMQCSYYGPLIHHELILYPTPHVFLGFFFGHRKRSVCRLYHSCTRTKPIPKAQIVHTQALKPSQQKNKSFSILPSQHQLQHQAQYLNRGGLSCQQASLDSTPNTKKKLKRLHYGLFLLKCFWDSHCLFLCALGSVARCQWSLPALSQVTMCPEYVLTRWAGNERALLQKYQWLCFGRTQRMSDAMPYLHFYIVSSINNTIEMGENNKLTVYVKDFYGDFAWVFGEFFFDQMLLQT